ncbi:MAG: hypothetical protein N3A53_07310, partial [Verrucomicrobiae bacterium]|nr:hypothetical protein [Verrucomicrobiae bacterium]
GRPFGFLALCRGAGIEHAATRGEARGSSRTCVRLDGAERQRACKRAGWVIPAGSTNTQNPNPHRLGFFCPFPQCWRGFRA